MDLMHCSLNKICSIQYGYPFDSAFFCEKGMPLIRIRDVVRGYTKTYTTEKCASEYIVKYGDILIGMDGEFNVAKWKSKEAFLNQRVCRLNPDLSRVNAEYLFYYMHTALKTIEGKTPYVTVKHLSAKELNKIEVPLPSLEDQNHIASLLGHVDRLMTFRQNQLVKLDELVKSRFVEMFGNVIHNDKGWSLMLFSEITTSRLGKMLDAKQQTGEHQYPYLANFNVQWFRFELTNMNQMDFSEADRKEFELCDGDVLICEGGEIGRCAVWHNQIQPCFFQKALHRVRCDQKIILPDYLTWWFKYNCDHGGFAAIEGAKATIAHLPGAKLKSLLVAVPNLELQAAFAAFVAEVDKSKLAVKQSLEKLETLKKSLMQQYFG